MPKILFVNASDNLRLRCLLVTNTQLTLLLSHNANQGNSQTNNDSDDNEGDTDGDSDD